MKKTIDIDKHKKIVPLEEMEVPVLCLGYEAKAYRRLGRLEMAEKLSKYSVIRSPDNFEK